MNRLFRHSRRNPFRILSLLLQWESSWAKRQRSSFLERVFSAPVERTRIFEKYPQMKLRTQGVSITFTPILQVADSSFSSFRTSVRIPSTFNRAGEEGSVRLWIVAYARRYDLMLMME